MDSSSAAGFTEPADEVPPPLDGSSGDTAAAAVKPVWNDPAKGSMAVLGISIWPSLSEAKEVSRKSSSSDESISDNASVASSQNLNNGNPIPARNHGAYTHHNFSRNAGTRTNRGPAPPLPRPVSSQMPGIRESSQQTRPHGGGLHHMSYANDQKRNHGGNQRFNNDRVEFHHRNNDTIHIQDQRGLTDWRQRNTGIGLQPPVPQGVRPSFRPAAPSFRPAAPSFRPAMSVLNPFMPHDQRFMPLMSYPAPPALPPLNYTAAPPALPPLNYTATPPPPPPLNYAAIAPPPTGIAPFVSYPSWSPISLPMLDDQRMQVLNQVEYYFSADNLARSSHLRFNMDDQGWVSVSLIASFPRILEFTQNIFDDRVREAFILDTVSSSAVVEVRDGKIRRRNDWAKWTIRRHVG